MNDKVVILALAVVFMLASCENTQPQIEEIKKDTTIIIEEQSDDDLLNGVVRASEMELPMLWTDTIYDTCQTSLSLDGKYAVFIGRTEEDKVLSDQHTTMYGLAGFDERNSIFLYDKNANTTSLLLTTSPEGFGAYLPQIDKKRGLVYYLRETDATGRSFMRYNLQTNKEEYLVGCFYTTVFKLKPNGNILFQDVREDVTVLDTGLSEDDSGWLGYVFCDIEMTPDGVCVNKSRYYDYENFDAKTGKSYDVSQMIILNNDDYKPRWEHQVAGYFNVFYDKNGYEVGFTFNNIESYDGWDGLKNMQNQ